MLGVQFINFVCTDFWSPYLLQMGAEILVSIADVDSDPLLSQLEVAKLFLNLQKLGIP